MVTGGIRKTELRSIGRSRVVDGPTNAPEISKRSGMKENEDSKTERIREVVYEDTKTKPGGLQRICSGWGTEILWGDRC